MEFASSPDLNDVNAIIKYVINRPTFKGEQAHLVDICCGIILNNLNKLEKPLMTFDSLTGNCRTTNILFYRSLNLSNWSINSISLCPKQQHLSFSFLFLFLPVFRCEAAI
jgi:hypothetical protein